MNAATLRVSQVNWACVALYGAALVVVRFAMGLLDGFFEPSATGSTWPWFAWKGVVALLQLVVCAALLARLVRQQSDRPILHGVLVLVVVCLVELLIAMNLPPWLFDYSDTHVVLDLWGYALLSSAFVAGIALGLRKSGGGR